MLKAGLIGCGFMGQMHANCYKNIEGVTLAAVADIRKEKAEDIAQGTEAAIYGDGMDLIENADVLIAKGQGNFETLRFCEKNIYYIFMCKCLMFAERFGVERFSGMLVNDLRLSDID